MATNSKLHTLPTESLRRCPLQLRTVSKETLDFYLLRDSIEKEGILNSILVRPVGEYYEVVDGNHRFEAILDLRIPEVACIIRELSDEDVIRLQLIAQCNRIDTSPATYATRLWKIVNIDSTLTVNEIAHSINKSPDWVKRIMGLVNLIQEAKSAVNDEKLSVTVGTHLARLPIGQQKSCLVAIEDMAQTEAIQFIQSEIRSYRGSSKGQKYEGITQPKFRSFNEVANEVNEPTQAASVILRCKAKDALEIWLAAIKWVLCIDDASIEARLQSQEKLQKKNHLLNLKRISEQSLSIGEKHE